MIIMKKKEIISNAHAQKDRECSSNACVTPFKSSLVHCNHSHDNDGDGNDVDDDDHVQRVCIELENGKT